MKKCITLLTLILAYRTCAIAGEENAKPMPPIMDYHAPVKQITDKGGFLLDFDRWSVCAPSTWSITRSIPATGYIPLSRFRSRAYRLQHRRVPGGDIWYRISLGHIPAELSTGDMVLEIEYPLVVCAVFADKQQARDITSGTYGVYARLARTGRNFIIRDPGKVEAVFIRVRDFAFRFDNHVGRVILRKPSLHDRMLISFNPVRKKRAVRAVVHNRVRMPLTGRLYVQVQDYFQRPLRTTSHELNLEPGKAFAFAEHAATPRDHKLVIWFTERTGRTSRAYWYKFPYSELTFNESGFRQHTLLTTGWSAHWVTAAQGFRFPLPPNGWTTSFPRKTSSFAALPADLPLYVGTRNLKTHRMWARCTFTAPALAPGRRFKLFLRSVFFQARFYVNNKFIAARHTHDLPDCIDLTEAVKPGAPNELLVAFTDYTSCRAPEAPKLKDEEHSTGHFIDTGFPLERQLGIGFSSVPVLAVTPEARVAHAAINTTFNGGKKISVIANLASDADHEITATLSAEVFDRDAGSIQLGEKSLTLRPNADTSAVFARDWPGAREWTFSTPHLYELRLTLRVHGKTVDRFSERFGFRQWGVRGDRFTLNGKIIAPYGDGQAILPRSGYWPLTPTNSRIVRMHLIARDEGMVTLADELGVAVTWEHAMSPFGGNAFLLGDDRLYRNLLAKWRHVIPHDRNHPAIFCYTLGNEPPTADKAACAKLYQHMQDVKALDPGKMVHFSRGNDLDGRSWFYSPHYLFHEHLLPTDLNLFSRDRPASAHLNRLLLQKQAYPTNYEKTWLYWQKQIPVFDSEGASVTDGHEYKPWRFGEGMLIRRPDEMKQRFSAAVGIARDIMRGELYEAYRKNRVSALLSHVGQRWGGEGLTPIAALMYEPEYRLSGSRKTNRTICVFNDTMQEEAITARINLAWTGGKSFFTNEQTLRIPAGEMRRWHVSLDIPAVTAPRYCFMTLEAFGRSSTHHYRKYMRMTIFPAPVSTANRTFADTVLFDPLGKVSRILAANGFTLRRITKLSRQQLPGNGVLVIADGAAARAEPWSGLLNSAVAKGMRLFFMQQPGMAYSFPFRVADGDNMANGIGCLLAAPSHPALAGLLPEDLRYWQNPSRIPLTYRNAPFMPDSPNTQVILTGGKTAFARELDFTPLFAVPHGRGMYLVSQMEILGSLSADPAARYLLANLLAWLAAPRPAPTGRFALKADPKTTAMLRNYANLDVSAGSDPKATRTLLVAGDVDFSTAEKQALKQTVENGGVLYLKGATRTQLALAAELFGIRATVTDRDGYEAIMTVHDPLFAGLSQYNWIWWRAVKYAGSRNESLLLGRRVIRVDSPGARPLLEPPYIVRVKVKSGWVILDSCLWGGSSLRKARAVTNTILSNLGAKFAARTETTDWKSLAASMHFFPLDLSPAVNVAFRDEKAGDGKGGWTDMGPSQYLGDFPIGLQHFNHIPFAIIDPGKNRGRSLVALRGYCWPRLPRASAEIPVRRKLDRIYFVHGCAWAMVKPGEEMARYVIHYADRRDWIPGKPLPRIEVPVKNQRHIWDWWFYDRIASGEYRMPEAVIAWRKRNRGVAMMEWINPYPEREIDAIQAISTTNKSQFFWFAATGAVKKKAATNITPQPVNKNEIPALLKNFKGRLWRIPAGELRLYLDYAARIRLVTDPAGTPLLDQCGEWNLQGRRNGRFFHVAGQHGRYLDMLRISRKPDSTLTLRIAHAPQPLLTWSQTVTIRGRMIRVEHEWRFNRKISSALQAAKAYLNISVSFADPTLDRTRRANVFEGGNMNFPGIGGWGMVVRFDPSFKQHHKGVWSRDDTGTVVLQPSAWNPAKIVPDKAYRAWFEVELSRQQP